MPTPPVNAAVRIRPGKLHSIRHLLEMQEVLYKATMNDTTAAKDKAACARAWDVLADRLRELRGQPKLAPVKPEMKRLLRHRQQRPLIIGVAP